MVGSFDVYFYLGLFPLFSFIQFLFVYNYVYYLFPIILYEISFFKSNSWRNTVLNEYFNKDLMMMMGFYTIFMFMFE